MSRPIVTNINTIKQMSLSFCERWKNIEWSPWYLPTRDIVIAWRSVSILCSIKTIDRRTMPF